MSYQIADDAYHSLALIHTPGIGHANAKFLLSHFRQLKDVFVADKRKLSKVPGIGEKAIRSIQSKEGYKKADLIVEKAEKQKQQIIPYTSPNYPEKLKLVMDAPFVLYYKGNEKMAIKRSIGIVGTRDATSYGQEITQKIVEELTPFKPSIISGLAYGIDIEAHRAALQNSLQTFAVLAGGLDRIYPSIHTKTVDRMMDQGGILSEQPPGTKPDAHLFPARNRIIAGMSDSVVVVEAKSKGGALITAEIADSYDRPVFAVPGNLDQPNSEGCNALIRSQKAVIYTRAKDVAYYHNWNENLTNVDTSNKPATLPALDSNEKKVYQILLDHPSGIKIDDLAWKSSTQINQLASLLLSMEFKGLVKAMPGSKYKGIN